MLNWPNTFSLMRIFIAPLLIYLAVKQLPFLYMFALVCAIATDLLDGFLARYFNQVTTLGSKLDSWGDFIIYSTMGFCAWILWPDIVIREQVYFILLAASFVIPALVGLVKFSATTSYHTLSTKIAVAVTVIGYLLLFSNVAEWPLKIGVLLAIYAGAEEIAISCVLSEARADVRSIWQVLSAADK